MRMEKGELMWVCPRSFTERRMVDMKYVPILEELFSSDSVIILLIGLGFAFLVSLVIRIIIRKNRY